MLAPVRLFDEGREIGRNLGRYAMLRAASAVIALVAGVGISAESAWAQAPSRLKSITENKVVKIAHRTDATPFSFTTDDRKEPRGYTIDICKQVVTSLGRQLGVQDLKVEWVPVTTQTRFEVVAKGDADLECGSSTVTLGRMKLVDFSNTVFVESTGLVVRKAAGIDNLKDLAGKKVAVIAGTSNENALVLQNRHLQLNATVVPVKDRDEAIAALDSGQVDAFASDKLLLVGTRFKDDQTLRLLPDDLSIEPYAIALPRADWELRLAVNTGLAELYRGGEVRKIYDRWFGQLGLQPGILLGAAYLLGALQE
jgi:ABC-type amino acid transport substrate-binding protein